MQTMYQQQIVQTMDGEIQFKIQHLSCCSVQNLAQIHNAKQLQTKHRTHQYSLKIHTDFTNLIGIYFIKKITYLNSQQRVITKNAQHRLS